MTTTYGTISTATAPPERWIRSSDLGKRRPWKELVSFSLPRSFKGSLSRIKTNLSYFHTNYAIIIIFVLFLSLLWRPISLIIFMVLLFAWLFLYFLRDDPIVIFGYEVDEHVVLAVLSISTVTLLLTHATVNVVAGLAVGTAVVLLHGAFRRTDDLIVLDEEQGGAPRSSVKVNLKETASSSSSSSNL